MPSGRVCSTAKRPVPALVPPKKGSSAASTKKDCSSNERTSVRFSTTSTRTGAGTRKVAWRTSSAARESPPFSRTSASCQPGDSLGSTTSRLLTPPEGNATVRVQTDLPSRRNSAAVAPSTSPKLDTVAKGVLVSETESWSPVTAKFGAIASPTGRKVTATSLGSVTAPRDSALDRCRSLTTTMDDSNAASLLAISRTASRKASPSSAVEGRAVTEDSFWAVTGAGAKGAITSDRAAAPTRAARSSLPRAPRAPRAALRAASQRFPPESFAVRLSDRSNTTTTWRRGRLAVPPRLFGRNGRVKARTIRAKISSRSRSRKRFRSLLREELRVSCASKKRSVLNLSFWFRRLSSRWISTGMPRPARAVSRKALVSRKGTRLLVGGPWFP